MPDTCHCRCFSCFMGTHNQCINCTWVEPPTATLTFEDPIGMAKAYLVANGYVVHRAKSWRQLLERVRVAEALQRSAEEHRESTQRWAQTALHNDIRDLMARCTFLYGMARAKGATVEELRGGWTVTGANLPIEKTQTLQCHCGIHPYIIHDESARPTTRLICPDHGLVLITRTNANS